ncbi:MAG: YggS family pyridoxal phosphate-dependent enzyme [Spirochaetales bacterium]|nr:YggS family pyridoxal phosphate-dependent enzyme [Spirochaetales bacterium]
MSVPTIKDNLEAVRASLEKAAERAGRKASEVSLMAVSKTKPLELVREAYDAGQRLFGENRVAEAVEKFSLLPGDAEVHLIGHLQKNKIKTAVPVFHCIESLDSIELARKLAAACEKQERMVEVLLQLKTADEGGKTGFAAEEEILEAAGWVREQKFLRIRGLMTIAPFTSDESAVRGAFARCKTLQEKLMSLYRDVDFSTLSMGMSSDYEWAVQEGSTLIRVGTAIFGGRF